MRIHLSDVSLFCLDIRPDADSKGTVLFIHGFPLDHTMWTEQVDALSKTHRCLAPDLRGFGESTLGSESTNSESSMAAYADDLASLLDELSIKEPVTICGLSMGGYVALEMWQRHREKIDRMILCDTRAESDPPEVARGRQMMANQVSEHGMAGVADGMIPKLLAPPTLENNAALVQRLRKTIDGANAAAVAAAQNGMATRASFVEKLPKIDIPTLVICGTHDSITNLATMTALASSLPNSVFVEIPEAGHLAPMERPKKVNEAILNWLG